MWLSLQYQGTLAPVTTGSKQPCAEVKAPLHRHVESRNSGRGYFGSRQIMYAPIALADHLGNFADRDFRAVRRIKGTPRVIARCDDRKSHRTEDRLEPVVEAAVDENGLGSGRASRALLYHSIARTSSVARHGWLAQWRNADHVSAES